LAADTTILAAIAVEANFISPPASALHFIGAQGKV